MAAVEAEAAPAARNASTETALSKVPWKKVAQWMVDHRGCYRYGNATVKKKYDELVQERKRMNRVTGEHYDY